MPGRVRPCRPAPFNIGFQALHGGLAGASWGVRRGAKSMLYSLSMGTGARMLFAFSCAQQAEFTPLQIRNHYASSRYRPAASKPPRHALAKAGTEQVERRNAWRSATFPDRFADHRRTIRQVLELVRKIHWGMV